MNVYNCHAHIFNLDCAPDRFLETYVGTVGAWALRTVLAVPKLRDGLLWLLDKAGAAVAPAAHKYAAFLRVGTDLSQASIFEQKLVPNYPPGTRFVVLAINFDMMGAGTARLNYESQLWQLLEVRKRNPNTCLPFVSIDPRMGTRDQNRAFVEKWLGRGFVGIKLYPSLGFYPFDERLFGVYELAQTHGVPIMTHCTRGGVFYQGAITDYLRSPELPADAERKLYGKDLPLDLAGNDVFCDFFLDPRAYDIVLSEYPELKLCLAHYGGDEDIIKEQIRAAVGIAEAAEKAVRDAAVMANAPAQGEAIQALVEAVDAEWEVTNAKIAVQLANQAVAAARPEQVAAAQAAAREAAQRVAAAEEIEKQKRTDEKELTAKAKAIEQSENRKINEAVAQVTAAKTAAAKAVAKAAAKRAASSPSGPADELENWYNGIRWLMCKYPNVYTDVSYTLAQEKNFATAKHSFFKLVHNDLTTLGSPYARRLLFGTDFFMVTREQEESGLAVDLMNALLKADAEVPKLNPSTTPPVSSWRWLATFNPACYLHSSFYTPVERLNEEIYKRSFTSTQERGIRPKPGSPTLPPVEPPAVAPVPAAPANNA